MLKKIISLLLTASVLMSLCVYAQADIDSEIDDSYQEQETLKTEDIYQNENQMNESLDKIEDETQVNVSSVDGFDIFEGLDAVWPIPDYDKTGMTDSEIIMKNLYYTTLYNMGSIANIDATIDQMYKDYIPGGYFVGPDYWAWDLGNLPAARQFKYLQHMAAGYQLPESKYYHNEDVWNKMHECIDFWMKTITRCYVWPAPSSYSNWWNDTIGRGLSIMPFLGIANGLISREVLDPLIEKHLYAARQVAPGICTGTNAIWFAQQSIIKGAYFNDSSLIEEGVEIILDTMRPATAHGALAVVGFGERKGMEGIQTDNSYHMHGTKYYATYANAFEYFTDVSKYIHGTSYEMSEVYDVCIDAIIDGWVWTTRGGDMDLNTLGRMYAQNGSPVYEEGKMSDTDSDWVKRLKPYKILVPDRADEIDEAIKTCLAYDNPERVYRVGNKYFYRSDYMTHHRKGWTLFTQANSWRSYASEHNTKDGINSYWLGFGHTLLYKGDDLYAGSLMGLPMFWDPTKLPGVTSSDYVHKSNIAGHAYHQQGKFVGGVSDGMYGVNTMYLEDRAGVSAKKSWFYFDDEFVSLGSGITSSSKYNTQTTVDSRRHVTDIEVDGKIIEPGKYEFKNVSSVMQYGIGYVFPEKEDIVIEAETVSSRLTDHQKWNTSDDALRKTDLFTVYVPHGKNVRNDTYAYITIPETDTESLTEYVENNPIEISANTPDVQAVLHKNLNIAGASFYKAGKVSFTNGLTVKVDDACCMMARVTDGKLKLYVSNPYAEKITVNVSVTYNGKTQSLKFDLPGIDAKGYQYGGKTIEKEIEL